TGVTREIELIAEREVVGTMATTVIMPEDEISDWDSLPFPEWHPIEFDPVPVGSSGGMAPIPITLSPALYMATGQYVGRTREVGQASPSYERLFSYTTDFENTPIRRFALDPWDPKNRAYVLCGDIDKNISLKLFEITNLDGPVGTQTITKVLDQPLSDLLPVSKHWLEFAFEASITMEGAVAILARIQDGSLPSMRGLHFVLTRTGYGGAWRKVNVGQQHFG